MIDKGQDTNCAQNKQLRVECALGYEIITKYSGYKASCRDMAKKLADTGGDIHCMGTAEFVDPNYPNETCRFEDGWSWIQQQPGGKQVIVVEMTSCVGRVT